MTRRAVVAMSGGVDSSVAAALMKEEGWLVSGVTLRLLARGETGFGCCGSPADVDDAKRVCETLGIPHYSLDMAQLFEDKVIRPFVDSYIGGRTPNPCAECNRALKFGHLLDLAEAWGAECVATGHYARLSEGRLLRPRDREKDQTYFLHALSPRELGRARFPLGDLTKAEVRAKARALGLKTADKPESQEICFVPRRDYRRFVAERAGSGSAGPVVDSAGRELGRHGGLAGYTVGQRRGLGLSGSPEPLYVTELKPETGTLVVGPASEVLARGLLASGMSWTGPVPAAGSRAAVRIRHRHEPAPARIFPLPGGGLRAEFDAPQRAVAPGQSAVIYDGDLVLGGGAIAESLPREVAP